MCLTFKANKFGRNKKAASRTEQESGSNKCQKDVSAPNYVKLGKVEFLKCLSFIFFYLFSNVMNNIPFMFSLAAD